MKPLPDSHACGMIQPIKLTDENIGCFNDYASLALDEFNRNEVIDHTLIVVNKMILMVLLFSLSSLCRVSSCDSKVFKV